MKTIRIFLILSLGLLIANPAYTQIDLLRKVKKKTEQKADEAVDDELDKIFSGKKDESGAPENGSVQPATI